MKKYKYKATNLITDTLEKYDVLFTVYETIGNEVIQTVFSVSFGPAAVLNYIVIGSSNDVDMICTGLVNNIPPEKHERAKNVCNDANGIPYFKFVLSPVGDINMTYRLPANISDEHLGQIAYEMYKQAEQILNEKYKSLIKSLYIESDSESDPNKLYEMHRQNREAMFRKRQESMYPFEKDKADVDSHKKNVFPDVVLTEEELRKNLEFLDIMGRENTGYMNVTATLLTEQIKMSGSDKDYSVVKVHFDVPGAPEISALKVDERAYVNRRFRAGEKVRVISAFKDVSGAPNFFPAIISEENFEDIFFGEVRFLRMFRQCDRSVQELVICRSKEKNYYSESKERVHLKDMRSAKLLYSLSKGAFTENQQVYIEDWLDNYSKGNNAEKLEMLLSISTADNSKCNCSLKEMKERLDICLVGPPGTGKTEFGKEISKVLNKPFAFIPCSVITSANDVSGDRAVYKEASVGKFVEAFYKLKTSDAIVLLDEFDKMPGIRTASIDKDGNPYHAFVQVFNEKEITDVFLGTEILCHNTIFICTCNSLDNIPNFIKNRFDSIISIPAYSDDLRVQIALEHTIPGLNEKYELYEEEILFSDEAVREVLSIVDDSGARLMEKYIERIYKHIIYQWEENGCVCKTYVTRELVRKVFRKEMRTQFFKMKSLENKAFLQ